MVRVEVCQLLTQPRFVLAQRIDPPTNRRHMLAIEFLNDFSHFPGFNGGRPLPFAIPLKLCRYSSIVGHLLH